MREYAAQVALSPVHKRFVLHWGEMGTRWGVNRTVAQVHALLYLSPRPLNAEQIARTLSIARSNASTSLRELESWGIVKAVHLLGERREHYESGKDIWEMARVILDERKRREIDPTLAMLRQCVAELEKARPADATLKPRLVEMLDFLESMVSLYEDLRRLPAGTMRGIAKLKGKVRKFLGKQSSS